MTNLSYWLLNDQGKNTASPFSYTFNTNLEYYTWLEEPGNEQRLVRFGHAMHGTQQFEIAENIITGTCPRPRPLPSSSHRVRACFIYPCVLAIGVLDSLARPGTCARGSIPVFNCPLRRSRALKLSDSQIDVTPFADRASAQGSRGKSSPATRSWSTWAAGSAPSRSSSLRGTPTSASSSRTVRRSALSDAPYVTSPLLTGLVGRADRWRFDVSCPRTPPPAIALASFFARM